MEHAGFIDGRFKRGTSAALRVENPSDESTVAELVGLSLDQVADAIAAARRAFDDGRWCGQTASQRADTMRRFGVRRLIHGHTHRPATHSLEINGQAAQRIVLGDWDQQGWALQIDANGYQQASFAL